MNYTPANSVGYTWMWPFEINKLAKKCQKHMNQYVHGLLSMFGPAMTCHWPLYMVNWSIKFFFRKFKILLKFLSANIHEYHHYCAYLNLCVWSDKLYLANNTLNSMLKHNPCWGCHYNGIVNGKFYTWNRLSNQLFISFLTSLAFRMYTGAIPQHILHYIELINTFNDY